MPTSDLQWQARKLAIRASKLADRAGPMTSMARRSARSRGGEAAKWARPRVGRARAWMAARADQGSTKVQESWGPKLSAALAVTAKKLDPPKTRTRRWPKALAATALIAAGVAAAAAMASRSRSRRAGQFLPPRPVSQPETGSTVKMQDQAQKAAKEQAKADANGMARTR